MVPRMTGPTKEKYRKRNSKIYELYESGITLAEIGRMYGVTREAIRRVIRTVESERKT